MPNDAKMGLVAGVAVVVLIAALFFRKDAQVELTSPGALPTTRTVAPSPPAVPRPPSVDSDLPPPPLPDLPPTGAG